MVDGPARLVEKSRLDGEPVVLADNLACLDYSVAMDGSLVAYRLEGEEKLLSAKLFAVR